MFIGLPTPGLEFHLTAGDRDACWWKFLWRAQNSPGSKTAILPVPEKAANSQVLGTVKNSPTTRGNSYRKD